MCVLAAHEGAPDEEQRMILHRLEMTAQEFERRTGWAIKPQGACKEDRCVPLPETAGDLVQVGILAGRLGMALVHDEAHSLWALGPESGSRALETAQAPDLRLPDWKGNDFSLRSLRGMKVFLLA